MFVKDKCIWSGTYEDYSFGVREQVFPKQELDEDGEIIFHPFKENFKTYDDSEHRFNSCIKAEIYEVTEMLKFVEEDFKLAGIEFSVGTHEISIGGVKILYDKDNMKNLLESIYKNQKLWL